MTGSRFHWLRPIATNWAHEVTRRRLPRILPQTAGDWNAELFYAPGTCALASHIALERGRRGLRAGAPRSSPATSSASPGLSEGQSQGPRAGAGHRPRHPDGNAGDPRLHRPDLSAGQPGAAGRSVRIRPVQSFNSYLCSTVHVAHAHRMRGYRWADEPAAIPAMQRKVPQSVGECFALIEREMLKGPWVMGETLHDLRSLSLHRSRSGSTATASTSTGRRRSPITSGASANGRRCAGRSRRSCVQRRLQGGLV